MILEGDEQVSTRAGARDSSEFLISTQESPKLLTLATLKKRNGSHKQGESVLGKDWLPHVTFRGQFISHLAHGSFVFLQLFQRSTGSKQASSSFPFFFQSALEQGVVVA